jgi:hypothetical protein
VKGSIDPLIRPAATFSLREKGLKVPSPWRERARVRGGVMRFSEKTMKPITI